MNSEERMIIFRKPISVSSLEAMVSVLATGRPGNTSWPKPTWTKQGRGTSFNHFLYQIGNQNPEKAACL